MVLYQAQRQKVLLAAGGVRAGRPRRRADRLSATALRYDNAFQLVLFGQSGLIRSCVPVRSGCPFSLRDVTSIENSEAIKRLLREAERAIPGKRT